MVVCLSHDNRIIAHSVYLLNERNTGFEVHAEVNELPDDSFLLVLLLLEDEHVVVEELLETLVSVVDTQLLERVILRDTQQVVSYQ